jgi:methionyl-tRNA formyltransferase
VILSTEEKKPLRIVFAGSSSFSNLVLTALLQQNEQIIQVLTQPDKPSGRGQQVHSTAVKETAIARHISVATPRTLRDPEITSQLQSLHADVLLVVAYGLLIPQSILSLFPYPINVHPSLLPRWRGATPIESPLLAGDTTSGVTIMEMVAALDAGPILKQHAFVLSPEETRDSLYQRLLPLSIELLIATLNDIRQNQVQKTPQEDALACYAHKWTKADLHIHWQKSAIEIDRQIRAFAKTPGAYTQLETTSIKILHATIDTSLENNPSHAGQISLFNRQGLWVQTQQHHICITELQLAGKKPMSIQDVWNGHRQYFTPGRQLQ